MPDIQINKNIIFSRTVNLAKTVFPKTSFRSGFTILFHHIFSVCLAGGVQKKYPSLGLFNFFLSERFENTDFRGDGFSSGNALKKMHVYLLLFPFFFFFSAFSLHAETFNDPNCAVSFSVDLRSSAESTWTAPDAIETGEVCCSSEEDHRCFELIIELHEDALAVNISFPDSVTLFYFIDCTEIMTINDDNSLTICIDDPSQPLSVVFCRPGDKSFHPTVTSLVSGIENMSFDPVGPLCIDAAPVALDNSLVSPEGGNFYINNETSPSSEFAPEDLGLGEHIIEYLYTDPETGCKGLISQTVTINELPELDCSDPDASVCQGSEPVHLAEFYDQLPQEGVFFLDGEEITDFIPADPGVFSFQYLYTDPETGCSATCDFSITVLPLPDANDPSLDLCSEDGSPPLADLTLLEDQINGGQGINYSYFSDQDLQIAINDAGAVPVSNGDTFYVEVTDGQQCSAVAVISAAVSFLEVTDVEVVLCDESGDGSLSAFQVDLNDHLEDMIVSTGDDADPDISWYSDEGLSNGIPSGMVDEATNSDTFYAEFSLGACVEVAALSFSILPLPDINCFTETLCEDAGPLDLNTLVSEPGGDFSGTGVSGNSFDPAAAGAGTHMITYTYTNEETGCQNSCNLEIEVVELPQVDCPANMAFCQDHDPVLLDPSTALDFSFEGDGDGVVVTDGEYWFDPSLAGPGIHTITLEIQENGCTNQCTFTIEVSAMPAPSCPEDINACVGAAPIVLNNLAISPAGGIFSGEQVSANGDDYIFDPGQAGTFSVFYEYTDATTNCSASCTFQITVHDVPEAVCEGTTHYEVCKGQPAFSLDQAFPEIASSDGVFTYDGNEIISFTPNTAGTFDILYTFSDTVTTCERFCELTITVNPLPVVLENTLTVDLCDAEGIGYVNVNLTDYQDQISEEEGVAFTFFTDNQFENPVSDPQSLDVGHNDDFWVQVSYPETGCASRSRIIFKVESPDIDSDILIELCDESGDDSLEVPNTNLSTFNNEVFSIGGSFTIDWYADAGLTNPVTGSFTLVNGATYYALVRVGACELVSEVTFLVNPLPVLDCTVFDDMDICLDAEPVDLFEEYHQADPSGSFSTGGSQLTVFDPQEQGSGNYNLTYTYANEDGCRASCEFDILVRQLPVADTLYPEFCNPSGTRLVDLDSLGNEINSQSGTTIAFYADANLETLLPDPNNYEANDGDTVFVKVENEHCSNSSFIHFSVDSALTLDKDSLVFCDESVDGSREIYNVDLTGFHNDLISGSQDYSFEWFDDDGYSSLIENNIETINHNDIYYLDVQWDQCQTRSPITFQVKPQPEIVCSTDPYPVCVNSDPVLLDTTEIVSPAGGVFTGGGVTDGYFDPAGFDAGITTISYTYTDDDGCEASCEIELEITDVTPAVCVGDTVYFCIASGVHALGQGQPEGGEYEGAGVYWNESENAWYFNPEDAGTGSHEITYTYEENGCSDLCTFIVTVRDQPQVYCPGDQEICINSGPFVLDNLISTPEGGIYMGDHVEQDADGTFIFDPQQAGAGIDSVRYEYTDPLTGSVDCCGFVITVTPLTEVVCTPAEVCENTPVFNLFEQVTVGGGVFSGTGVTSDTLFDPSEAGVGLHEITYVLEDENNCETTCTFTVEVNPVIQPECPEQPVYLCTDSVLFLPGIVDPAGGTFTGTGVMEQNGDPWFDASSAGTGAWTINYSYENDFGCVSVCAFEIIVQDLPDLTCPADLTLCLNAGEIDLADLTHSPSGGTFTGTGITTATDSYLFDPETAGAGQHTIVYEVTDDLTGCSKTCTFTITVNELPDTSFCNDYLICQGEPSIDMEAIFGESGFKTVFSLNNEQINSFDPENVGEYVIVAEKTNPETNCSATCTFSITVNPLPGVQDLALSLCDEQETGSVMTDLTGFEGLITHEEGVSFQYFFEDNTPVNDPVNTMISNDDQILVLVEDEDTGCSSMATLTFQTGNLTLQPLQLDICDETDGNIQAFDVDLNDFNDQIFTGGVQTTYQWYADEDLTELIENNIPVINDGDSWYVNVNNDGCESSALVTFRVRPLPDLLCEDVSACLNVSDYPLLSSVSLEGGLFSGEFVTSDVFNAAQAGLGVHEVEYVYTDDNGCVSSCFFTVEVQDPPLVSAPSDQVFCLNAGLRPLSGESPGGGIYTGPGISVIDGSYYFNPLVAGLGTHIITYTYTDGVCEVKSNFNIEVLSLPEVSCHEDIVVCEDAAPVLLGFSPAGGNLTGEGVSMQDGDYYFDPSLASPGVYTLEYFYQEADGECLNSCTFTATVQSLPELTISEDVSFCYHEEPVSLNLVEPSGGAYSGDFVQDGLLFNMEEAGVGQHAVLYTYTDDNQCSADTEVTINIHESPSATLSAVSSANHCESIQLQATVEAGTEPYTWQWSPTALFEDASLPEPQTYPLGGDADFVFHVTDANGCEDTASIHVAVNDGVNVVLPSFPGICETGSYLELTGGQPSGGHYFINNDTEPSLFFIPSERGAGNHDVTYVVESEEGCLSFQTQQVTVYPKPVLQWEGQQFCLDEEMVLLEGALPSGGSYTGNFVWNDYFDANASGTGEFRVNYIYTDSLGCRNTASSKVIIDPLPSAQAGPDQIISINTYTTLEAEETGSEATFHWKPEVFLINPQQRTTFTRDLLFSQSFRVEVTDPQTQCVNEDELTVFIEGGNFELINVRSSPNNVCPGDSLILSALISGGDLPYQYYWYDEDPEVSTDATPLNGDPDLYNFTVFPSASTVYYLKTISNTGQELFGQVEVTVNELPNVQLGPFAAVCQDESFDFGTLQPIPEGGVFEIRNKGGQTIAGPFAEDHILYPGDLAPGNYTLVYQFENEAGCIAEDSQPLVIPDVHAAFSVSVPDPCNPYRIRITNQSYGTDTHVWTFDDGDDPVEINDPVFTYEYDPTESPQSYTIGLTAAHDDCPASAQRQITITPPPVAGFSLPDAACSPFSAELENTTTGQNITGFLWDFDDGTFSEEQDPQKVFTNTTRADVIQTVKLTVYYQGGLCANTDEQELVVYPEITPGFSILPQTVCHPATIQITDESVNANGYLWQMGDGNNYEFSGEEAPAVLNHTYADPGEEPDTLIIHQQLWLERNAQQVCAQHWQDSVFLLPQSIAVAEVIGWDVSIGSLEFCGPETLTLSAENAQNADQISWLLDGEEIGTLPEFSYSFSNTGDQVAEHQLVLETSTSLGCTDSDTLQITVYPEVQAAFSFGQESQCSPAVISVQNNSSAPSGTVFEWFVNNSLVSNEQEPVLELEHGSDFPIEYEIRLVLSTSDGCSSQSTESLVIHPKPGSSIVSDPEPSGTEALEGCAPFTAKFFASQQVEGETHNWFINGESAGFESDQIEYVFEQPGEHLVVLHTTNPYECDYADTVTVWVHPAPSVMLNPDTDQGCSPLRVQLGYPFELNPEWIYSIDFQGNGEFQSFSYDDLPDQFVYQHGESDVEVYSLTFRVENEYGCVHEVSKEITVFPSSVAMISDPDGQELEELSGCHPLEAGLSGMLSENVDAYQWHLGDGTVSQEANILHVFRNLTLDQPRDYSIVLQTITQHGCTSSDTLPVTVFPSPLADFEMDQDQGCSPLQVNFTQTSSGAVSYQWNFGDGAQSDDPDPQHSYVVTDGEQSQVFYSHLQVTNAFGCTDDTQQNIEVHPSVAVQFEADKTEGCSPVTVSFTNNSEGTGVTYSWDYGDGQQSDIQDSEHTHTFVNNDPLRDTVFVVTLSAQRGDFCETVQQKLIRVKATPVAGFSLSEAQGCEPFDLVIQNESTPGLSYYWQPGNGEPEEPLGDNSHDYTYFANGLESQFYPVLTVESENGCTAEVTDSIMVFPKPSASFTMSAAQGCHPLSVGFSNQSTGAQSYTWNFGNGGQSSEIDPQSVFINPSHTQTESYVVTLEAESARGCRDITTGHVEVHPIPDAAFDLSLAAGCAPFAPAITNNSEGGVFYRWDFGNETVSSEQDPAYTWNNTGDDPAYFDLNLNISNVYGCEASYGQTVTVYPEIVAEIGTETNAFQGCSPLELQFISQSENAGSWSWDFGDGTHSTSSHPFHLFENDQETTLVFPMTMQVTSAFGCTDSVEQQITVFPEPFADFSISPIEQSYPNTTFTLTNHTHPEEWDVIWDFGDGNVSQNNQSTFDYTYQWDETDFSTSEYLVSFTVTNGYCSDEQSQMVTIISPFPQASFESSVLKGCAPLEISLTNQSEYADSWYWDFGDQNISYEKNPRYIYFDPGNYEITLVAIGKGGNDTIKTQVEVYATPVADFEIVDPLIELPLESLQVMNLSEDADGYLWDFGDGNVSSDFQPAHFYNETGLYTITLTAFTQTEPSCADTLIRGNEVRAEEACRMIFPTGFTPVKTGPGGGAYNPNARSNEVFYPVNMGIQDYELEIYNKWGERIFYSDDIEKGWDGYIDGKPAPMGVYVWKAKARCSSGKRIEKAGDVTLLR